MNDDGFDSIRASTRSPGAATRSRLPQNVARRDLARGASASSDASITPLHVHRRHQ
jgi:hypothetical protein